MKVLANVLINCSFFLIFISINLISKNCPPQTCYENSLKRYFTIKNNPANQKKASSNTCKLQTPKQHRNFSTTFKIHIAYVHFLETKDAKSIENFKFFMYFAYQPCSSLIDFTFIFHTESESLNVFSELKKLFDDDEELIGKLKYCENTQLKYRPNKGGDLCAFNKLINSKFWKWKETQYQFYFFINSSVRGPFLPAYWTRPWWEIFTNMFFDNNERLVAVGPYLSCQHHPHIQSFFIAVDKRGLDILKKTWRCQLKDENRVFWIYDTEVKVGKKIFESCYEMRGLIMALNQRTTYKDLQPCIETNPTHMYPISHKMANSLMSEQKIGLCNQEFLEKDYYSAGIFEVTWVKYGGKITDDQLSNNLERYVPLHTLIRYENKKFLDNKNKAKDN